MAAPCICLTSRQPGLTDDPGHADTHPNRDGHRHTTGSVQLLSHDSEHGLADAHTNVDQHGDTDSYTFTNSDVDVHSDLDADRYPYPITYAHGHARTADSCTAHPDG